MKIEAVGMTTAQPTTHTTSARPKPGLLNARYRAFTVGSIALTSLSAFEALAVATAMPTVAEALHGLALYALAFGMPMAASVVGMVTSGVWSDARGPVAPMLHGIGWFALGLLIAGTAPAMEMVVVGRAVQGFGTGMFSVALYVVVARLYPSELHPKIFGTFAAAWVVPSLIGPAIAGGIVEYLHWRLIFLAAPALIVVAALLMWPGLRNLPPTTPTSLASGSLQRIGWAAGAAVSAALLHYAGQQRNLMAGVLLVVALIGLTICAPRLLPAGFLRARRGIPAVVLLRALTASAFFGAEVFIPLMLSRERGLPPALAGLALTMASLAWAAGSWLQGWSRQPLSRTALLRLGLLLIASGIGVAALTVTELVPVFVGILGWGVAGLGMGVFYPILSVLILELSSPEEQGRNSSALQLGESLWAAVTLALVGTLFAASADPGLGTYLTGFALTGALALFAATLTSRVRPA